MRDREIGKFEIVVCYVVKFYQMIRIVYYLYFENYIEFNMGYMFFYFLEIYEEFKFF